MYIETYWLYLSVVHLDNFRLMSVLTYTYFFMINSVLPMWAVGPYGRPPPHGFRRVIIVTLRVWLNVYRDILALSERSPFRQL